MKQEIIDADKS